MEVKFLSETKEWYYSLEAIGGFVPRIGERVVTEDARRCRVSMVSTLIAERLITVYLVED